MSDTVLSVLLDVGKEVIDSLLPSMSNDLFGLNMEFYFPIQNNSIYGEHDNQFTYSTEPDVVGRYLGLGGILSERWKSDKTIDLYNSSEPYVLTVGDEEVPLNTKVIVKLENEKLYTFRVRTIITFPGNDGYLYRKLMLVPMESKVS